MKNIYLIGFMGTGKSTVAEEIRRSTGAKLVEMDRLIVERQGMAIADIFDRRGEEYFRDLETELLRSLAGEKHIVASCGGGSVLRPENARLMKENGCIVLLKARPETIYERVKDSDERPILNGNMNLGFIRELMEERRERYEAVADIAIDVDDKSPEEICRELLKALETV